MLERPGDLIPILPEAAQLPWTRRRSQILNFLHRGPVTFSTLVYDTNVGDISTLSCYFNQERISVEELNSKYGHMPGEEGKKDKSLGMPRLLLYPERSTSTSHPAFRGGVLIPEDSCKEQQESSWPPSAAPQETQQVTAQRTFDWVLSQKLKAVLKVAEEEENRQNTRSTSLDEPGPDTVVPAELELPRAKIECLPQDELVCLPQDQVCLPQDELVCLHESENESSRVTSPDVMDRDSVLSGLIWSEIPENSGSLPW